MKILYKHKILCVFMFLAWDFSFGQELDSLIKTWTKEDYDKIIACGLGERGPLKRNYLLDICVPLTNLFQSSKRGAHIKLQFFVSNKIAIGISAHSAFSETKINYGIIVQQPYINQNNLGLIAEYNFYRNKRIELSCLLDNGFVRTELKSKSIMVENKNKDNKNSPDSFNLLYATNKQYYISPILNFSFILFPLKEVYNSQLQLFSQIGYNYFIGGTQFGSARDFSYGFAQIGLRLLARKKAYKPYLIDKIKEYQKIEKDSTPK